MTVYKSMIRSVMTYRDETRSYLNKQKLIKTEKTQNMTLRQIAKSKSYLNNDKIRERTEMLAITDYVMKLNKTNYGIATHSNIYYKNDRK